MKRRRLPRTECADEPSDLAEIYKDFALDALEDLRECTKTLRQLKGSIQALLDMADPDEPPFEESDFAPEEEDFPQEDEAGSRGGSL